MKVKYTILPFVLFALLFSGCEEDNFLGADIEGIGAEPIPVSEFKASRESVDFTASETVYFELTFQQSTNWLVTLTGRNSGATQQFQNVSAAINESNSNWDGRGIPGPYFQKGEEVVATVSFPDYPEVESLMDTFTISDIEEASIEAVLISDFAKAPIYNFGGAEPVGGGWGSDFPVTVNTNTSYPLYDANAYLYFEGAPWQANSPYIDILQIHSNLADTLTETTLPLYSDPERVYVNLAVYNTGTADTWFRVQFNEDAAGENRNWDIRPDWVGWKFISIKYADLYTEGTASYDPTSISLTNFILLSDELETNPDRKAVSIAVDQFVISFDSPLGTINY